MSETRTCPNCGVAMQYRLGQFECPACGRMEMAPPKTVEMSNPATPVGVSRHDPGAQYRQTASSAPPQLPGGGYLPMGEVRSGGARPDPFATPGSSGDDPLRSEKNIYMGIQVGGVLIAILALWLGSDIVYELGMNPAGMPLPAITIGMLIGGAIGVAIMGWVLYGDEVWPKWTCFGCNGCSLILIVAGLLLGGPAAAAQQPNPMLSLAQLAIGVWFLSLLYRDIQNRQAR